MQVNNEDIKAKIKKSQHVQRCWDLSKQIPETDIDLLVYAATNCPSKQNFKFYKLHVITDRDKIEQIHSMTEGITNTEDELTTNPQTLANLLFVFESVEPTQNLKDKLLLKDHDKASIAKRDADMAIGVAGGYVNVLATMLGYGTGYCACFDGNDVSKAMGFDNEVRLMMGIGFKDPTRHRRMHHVSSKMMGRHLKEPIEVEYHR